MSRKWTFGQVRQLLDRVGFVQTPVAGKHVLYEHHPSGTLLVFRPHRQDESIDPMTLSIVRRTLDMRGFLGEDEFENALRESTMNGRAQAAKTKSRRRNQAKARRV